MQNYLKLSLLVFVLSFVISCGVSLLPSEVTTLLSKSTVAKSISKAQVEEDLQTNKCKLLVKGRSYNSRSGFTAAADIKNAAIGIDDWVKIDGENSYAVITYKWIPIDENGGTQLYVEFDTLLYK